MIWGHHTTVPRAEGFMTTTTCVESTNGRGSFAPAARRPGVRRVVLARSVVARAWNCDDKDYITQWPFLEVFAKNIEIGRFNLQRYQSGEHFSLLHTERSSLNTLHRLFAWMTYLNDVDVENGGSTSFSHYGVEVQPRKGLTLIWPAEWTHAHRGQVVQEGSKYIITGWMHFPK